MAAANFEGISEAALARYQESGWGGTFPSILSRVREIEEEVLFGNETSMSMQRNSV